MNSAHIVIGAMLLWLFNSASAQQSSTDPVAADFSRKEKRYEMEASTLDSQDIYRELERALTIIAIKSKRSSSVLPDLTDEDTIKGTVYASALRARRKQHKPKAAYYWGLYNSRICGALDASKNIGAAAKDCWADTLESFRIASDHGIASASFNVGLMYENGWGVAQSKFVAADWFIKAAEKHKKDGSREGALESLEAALRSVPDHPAAQRLKQQLLK